MTEARLPSRDAFLSGLREQGWLLVPGAVSPTLVARLSADLDAAYAVCRRVQDGNGVAAEMDGTVHHALGLGDAFLTQLEEFPLYEHFEDFFGGRFIVNTYGGVINQPSRPSYVCSVHRDLRTYSGELPLMLNMLVMLDDFTLDNGATYLLSGGHRRPAKPTDDEFFRDASRAVGAAGTMLVFDSNLWHAAGKNTTDRVRRALTVTFTRPFLKQQLDYPRLLGDAFGEQASPRLRQLIGYDARVPDSLDAWYQPPERRWYKRSQG